MATYNLADIWEACVDRVLDREAVVCGERRLTYADLEERSNRLAHHLSAQGVGVGDHVGLYLQNCPEYLEGMLACFKIRAVPVNVNYRYVADELSYLFTDADLVALLFHRQYADRVVEVRGAVPTLRHLIVVGDSDPAAASPGVDPLSWGAIDYDAALLAADPERRFGPRSGDDHYLMYTGGTTGMPKGVVWRQEDAFFACIGGGDPMRLQGPVASPEEIPDRIIDGTFVVLPCAPLIHAAAQWTSLSWWYCGGKVILLPGSFDGAEVWRTVEREKVGLLITVGDAMARPLIDAWDSEGPFDVSSLYSYSSGGAPLAPANKSRILEILPHAMMSDGYGSSETGAQGVQRIQPGEGFAGLNRFAPDPETTAVLGEDLAPVDPGSGQVGRVARTGRIPLRYHGDPDKSAETFVEVDGRRWVLTGDSAVVEADGTITLLGRGSVCINTGGEKVYPEEVEAVLKGHPGVYDAVVVGVPDARWGETVCAVVAPRGDRPTLEALAGFCRESLAGYKVPRRLVIVDEVVRSPVGKADYRWASRVAAAAED